MDFTANGFGIASLLLFVAAYAVVMAEERFHIRKSIPVMVAAGAIWILVAAAYAGSGNVDGAAEAVRHNILEFAELFLFLLAAVTFVNTMEERQVFDALRGWLVERELSLRALFWLTGLLAFVISPIADNLTTALVMGAVVMAIAGDNRQFVTIACVNLAVAANAGGAFSPFGDITTLMVWQHGSVPFTGFFHLLLPSVVNWVVPATIMSFAVGSQSPPKISQQVRLRPGAGTVVALFIATIVLTVSLHQFLHLPAALGMMTGLGVLNLYASLARRAGVRKERAQRLQRLQAVQLQQEAQLERGTGDAAAYEILSGFAEPNDPGDTFDIFHIMERVEWDTLMFFYGVVLCVGGLGALGYLSVMSHALYGGLGPTSANVLVGVLSAIVDNIPIMFAVLSMNPEMSTNQWLLVTLTAGVGGSLLSIGSAAGVALMGHARGSYTFMSHLKWTWAVALGYAASIGVHLLVNGQ